MTHRKVITVDGLSGSGKTSLSVLLAKKLGWAFLSSGKLYRALALLALRNSSDLNDPVALIKLLKDNRVELVLDDQLEGKLLLNSQDIENDIRSTDVSEATSIVSLHPEVRSFFLDFQREAFGNYSLVAEGRDMGTVVFPDAELKFFIEADQETRLARRAQQLKQAEPHQEAKLLNKQMKKEIVERDKRDSERDISPVKPSSDAIIIHNSAKTLTETMENMYDFAFKMGLVEDS